jgi:hypothetical protein
MSQDKLPKSTVFMTSVSANTAASQCGGTAQKFSTISAFRPLLTAAYFVSMVDYRRAFRPWTKSEQLTANKKFPMTDQCVIFCGQILKILKAGESVPGEQGMLI